MDSELLTRFILEALHGEIRGDNGFIDIDHPCSTVTEYYLELSKSSFLDIWSTTRFGDNASYIGKEVLTLTFQNYRILNFYNPTISYDIIPFSSWDDFESMRMQYSTLFDHKDIDIITIAGFITGYVAKNISDTPNLSLTLTYEQCNRSMHLIKQYFDSRRKEGTYIDRLIYTD